MATEEILYHITGNSQLSSTNVDEISAIVKEYPFFSPAQFLLALKQKKEHSYNYEYQLQKASLYFSNQVWLNYLLNEKEVAVPDLHLAEVEPLIQQSIESKEESIFPTSLIGSKNYHPHEEEDEKEVNAHAETEEIGDEVIEHEPDNSIPLNDDIPFDYSSLFTNTNSDIEVPTLEAVKGIFANNSSSDEATAEKKKIHLPKFPSILKEPIASVVSSSRIPSFTFITPAIKNEPATEEHSVSLEPSSSIYVSRPVPVIEEAEEEPAVEATIVPHVTEPEQKETETTETHQLTESSIPSYSFKGFSEEAPEHIPNDTVSLSEAFAKEQEQSEEAGDADDTDYTNNISSMISKQLEGFKKPVEENSKFEFENEHNLHTIDYFASQGIKIDLTKMPQDKLTVQMRRFTDWLKQIKKTDPNPQDLGTDPELEKAIQNIAKTSIEAKEIVTETMADVFIKQGKVNKAIQLYIKLSFLDPSKSTYFANKIQQLKGI